MAATQNPWPISHIVWWYSRFLRTSKETASARAEGDTQGTGDARGKRRTHAPFLTRGVTITWATEVALGRTIHSSNFFKISPPLVLDSATNARLRKHVKATVFTWSTFLSSSSPVSTVTRAGCVFGGLMCSWYSMAAWASDLCGFSLVGELGPGASAHEWATSARVFGSSPVMRESYVTRWRDTRLVRTFCSTFLKLTREATIIYSVLVSLVQRSGKEWPWKDSIRLSPKTNRILNLKDFLRPTRFFKRAMKGTKT